MKTHFTSNQLVVKLSVSNMLKSCDFYMRVLGFKLNNNYTINSGGNYGQNSYMQLDFNETLLNSFSIGLFKDINEPFNPKPQNGTVPSFIVSNIEDTLKTFITEKVTIDKNPDGSVIITNKSDKGYVDRFFFFRDPDNNSLVIRQNMN